jgi:alpha-N-arabinofuranosidase
LQPEQDFVIIAELKIGKTCVNSMPKVECKRHIANRLHRIVNGRNVMNYLQTFIPQLQMSASSQYHRFMPALVCLLCMLILTSSGSAENYDDTASGDISLGSGIKDNSTSPENTEKANLVVYPREKSAHPIPRYITGKFCEHLYFNITNGMDAQILKNPTLSEYFFSTGQESPDGVATFHFDHEEITRRIRNGAPRWGWPQNEIDALAQSWKSALACWWTKVGSVETSPDTGPYKGRAQRIRIQTAGEGIAQWTWLPLHRTRKYQFELQARSPDITKLTIAVFEPSGETICTQQTVSGINTQWRKFSGSLEIPDNLSPEKSYKFAVIGDKSGQLLLDSVLLYPADHINQADPDVIRFLRESHLPILRWPGGNFVSGYHWKDGIGPIERRPTLPNYAWGQQENNFFGTDEFIAFCRAVGCEPMICINAGSGTLQEAADWVEYCNGSVDTPMGKLRAANDHPEPYNVKHWEIGNELWGKWQYYWTTAEGYVDRYRQFVTTMLKADQNITLYACGAPVFWGKHWNDTLITKSANILRHTTDHPLIGGRVPADTDPLDVFRDFMAVPEVLEQKWTDLEKSMQQAGIKESRLAVTELQMFARIGQPSSSDAVRKLNHDTLVSPATQAEALYDVLIYHTAVRLAPFVEMITHSATVNHGGGLRKERERVYANPCHYAQAIFAAFSDATPVKVELSCSAKEAPIVLPDLKNVASKWTYKIIDSIAALAPDGSLLISIVHKGTDESIDLEIIIKDFEVDKEVEIQTLVSDKPWLGNSLENPERIIPKETVSLIKNGKMNLSIKPYSVVCIRVPSSK